MDNDNDFFSLANDFLTNYDTSGLDNDQDNFILYLDFARSLAWDISSTIGCSHLEEEAPMHRRSKDYIDELIITYPSLKDSLTWELASWTTIDLHFRDHHGLDLTDPRINWSFDT